MRTHGGLVFVLFAWLAAVGLIAVDGVALEAASARRVITPDLQSYGPVYMAGFGMNRVATRVHDDLYARCLVLRTSPTHPVALCSVDVIGLFFEDVHAIRIAARQRTGVAGLDVIVAATHNHEGPDTMGLWGPRQGVTGLNERYMDFLRAQVVDAIAEAFGKLRPAQMLLGTARDAVLTASYDDTRPPVVHDDVITVMALRDAAGKPLGTLVNWNDHPEALGSKNTELTADFLASFYRAMDSEGASVVFWNGALGGMQSPLGGKIPDPKTGETLREPTFRFAEVLGERLAAVARTAMDKGERTEVDSVTYAEVRVEMAVTNANFVAASRAGLFGKRKSMEGNAVLTTPVGLLRMAHKEKAVLEAAMIPGEAYPELSVGGIVDYPGADFPKAPHEKPYREILQGKVKMVVGLANDEIGYIIPVAEWDEHEPYLQDAEKDWYGEVNSPGPETAPRVAKALEDLVKGNQP